MEWRALDDGEGDEVNLKNSNGFLWDIGGEDKNEMM